MPRSPEPLSLLPPPASTVSCHAEMPFDLNGRRALVTGGGRGIGRAIAIALADAGADVAITSRKADEAGPTPPGVPAKRRRAGAPQLRVGGGGPIPGGFARLASQGGAVGTLVNNTRAD